MNDSVCQIAADLTAEFEHLAFARSEFPMLARWGVPDFSQTIHSLGCNYLTAFGRSLNFLACTEYPIRLRQNTESSIVRADVAWWDRDTEQPLLIAEFERCEPGRAALSLTTKARNLLHAHRVLPPGPRVLLLMGWKRSGIPAGDISGVRAVISNGFCAADGHALRGLGPDSRFILAIADMAADSDNVMRLAKIRIP